MTGEIGQVAQAIRIGSFGAAEREGNSVGNDPHAAGSERFNGGRKGWTRRDILGDDFDESQIASAFDGEGDFRTPADAEVKGRVQGFIG